MDSPAVCAFPPEAQSAVPFPSCQPERSLQQRIEPHLPRIRSVAHRLLGCDHLALDAVQEALLALWREPHQPDDPVGWLVRAVVHRSKHLRRSLRRRRHHEHAASVACELHRGCDNPLHTAYAHELGGEIEAAMANLPADQRTAMQLTLHGGMGYEAIAQRLGWPLGTVRSRLHRARQTLQDCLRGTLRERGNPSAP